MDAFGRMQEFIFDTCYCLGCLESGRLFAEEKGTLISRASSDLGQTFSRAVGVNQEISMI